MTEYGAEITSFFIILFFVNDSFICLLTRSETIVVIFTVIKYKKRMNLYPLVVRITYSKKSCLFDSLWCKTKIFDIVIIK